MKILLERSEKILKVLLNDDKLANQYLEGGFFRRRYRSSRGVTFTFEKRAHVLSLYISFDRYKDAKVLRRISRGRPVSELLTLSELARLPGAKIYISEVSLPDGRNVDLIDTLRFELQKFAEGVWESGGIEIEAERLRRQMTLNGLKDRLPGFYLECSPDTAKAGQVESGGSEVVFAHRVKELKPEIGLREKRRKGKDSRSEPMPNAERKREENSSHVLVPEKKRPDLPTDREPKVAPPMVPEVRDPDEIAECEGCDELFYERELIEVKPGIYVCGTCGDDGDVLTRLGLTPDEMESFWRLIRCGWCGQPLTETEPGRWLCHSCLLVIEEEPRSRTVTGPPDDKRPISPAIEAKDDGMRRLKFIHDFTIKPGRIVPAGTVVLGRRGPNLPSRYLPIYWDEMGVGWRVDLEDGHSTVVPFHAVEVLKPL